jgi:hypothetical protein
MATFCTPWGVLTNTENPASKLFDKATERGTEKAFDALMVGLATAIGGPAAGGAAAVKAFGDSLFD